MSVLFLVIGLPQSLEVVSQFWAIGGYLEQLLVALSLTDHFNSMTRGLIELRTLIFFFGGTACWILMGMVMLDKVKAS